MSGAHDPVLDLYFKTFAKRVAALRGFALGLYAECRVAYLLGARPSASGIDEVDLYWSAPTCNREVRIQVKSAHRLDPTATADFSIAPGPVSGRRAGDLWVFARHSGPDYNSGWQFLTTKSSRLRRFGDQKRVSASKLSLLGDWVPDLELLDVASVVAASLRG